MLSSISLNFTEISDPLSIPTQGVTIFVGANNSGKSLVLKELELDFSSYTAIDKKLLNDIQIVWPDQRQFDEYVDALAQNKPAGVSPEHIYVGRFNPNGRLETNTIMKDHLINNIENRRESRWVSSQFLRFFLIRLDGRTRFDLTDDRPKGDLLGSSDNILMHLFKNDKDRARVRDIVFDAFGVYFTIEQLSFADLRIRLSQVTPDDNEQHWNDAARKFHGDALHIKDASDGVQAFVGIVCAVLSGDYRAILIDEPEAFLHPPLARKLGYQLTSNLKAGGTLMASTHSPDFLMGCLQASSNVRVVRLEYSNGKSKGRIIDSDALTAFFKAPLLRSANVMSALFHDGVIVTESDNDRAFYAEIYYRLAEREKGYPAILFVNAQNKQTIRDIIGPLRQFGVPAAAIVDLDILKDGGSNWTQWMNAAAVPQASHVGLGQQRATISKIFADNEIDMNDGGISKLTKNDNAAASDLIDQMERYGIFPVRTGEVESWLSDLGIRSKKAAWTVAMLDRMGSDPSDAKYVKPAEGDVWDFMRKIVEWVRNPQRKGTD